MKKILSFLLLAAIGIFVPVFVLWKNIFPSFEYELKEADSYGISVVSEDYSGGQYFTVPVLGQYSFNNIKLAIYPRERQKADFKIRVAKGYKINTYPEGETIRDSRQLRELLYLDNQQPLPSGFLFSFDGSAYVISRGKYHPILSAEVFELMGYHWENIAALDSGIFNLLERGDKINYMSPHPDGTIVKEKNGSYYLIWEGKKRKIEEPDIIMETWEDFYWIDLNAAKPEYFSSCDARRKPETITCDFQLDKTGSYFGKTYIFEMNPEVIGGVENVRVKFSAKANFEKNYLRYVFGEIKNKLYLRYGQYF